MLNTLNGAGQPTRGVPYYAGGDAGHSGPPAICRLHRAGGRTLTITTLLFLAIGWASAQAPPQGFHSLSLRVGGKVVTCTSLGQPVVWIANYSLNDIAFTGPGDGIFLQIQYQPSVLLSMPNHLALFWLGHECGHAFQRTSDEMKADCWSAKTGVKQGWFDLPDYSELEETMKNNPGDLTHPPGP